MLVRSRIFVSIAITIALCPTIQQIIPHNINGGKVNKVRNILKSSERKLEMHIFTFLLRTDCLKIFNCND